MQGWDEGSARGIRTQPEIQIHKGREEVRGGRKWVWRADNPGRDQARGEEKAQEWGGGTAERTQKRQAESMRRRG